MPVNIRVTDANDNSPVFRSATYHVNISEAGFSLPRSFFPANGAESREQRLTLNHLNAQATVAGAVVLQGIQALDADQPGPYSTVQYSILPGPFSVLLVLVNRSSRRGANRSFPPLRTCSASRPRSRALSS